MPANRASSLFALALLATAMGALSPAHAQPFHTGTLSGPAAQIGQTINYQITVTGGPDGPAPGLGHPVFIVTRGSGVQRTGTWSGTSWGCSSPDPQTMVCFYNYPNNLAPGAQTTPLTLGYTVPGPAYPSDCWAHTVPVIPGPPTDVGNPGDPDYRKLFTPGPCVVLAVADAWYANAGPDFTNQYRTMDIEGTSILTPGDHKTYWRNPAGGVWEDGANWTNGVPWFTSNGDGPDAVFTIPGTYTVVSADDFTSPTARRVEIEEGEVSLDITEPIQVPPNYPDCLPNCFPQVLPRFLIVEEALEVSAGATLRLCGSSWIGGTITNHGSLPPGCSPGQIHVMGDFTQGPTGTLEIELGNPYDRLIVDGTATLDGVLKLTALGNIVGQTFQFLQAGAVVGDFSEVQNLTGVELTVDAETGEITSPVEVPAIGLPGLVLLSAALLGTARARRRRRG